MRHSGTDRDVESTSGLECTPTDNTDQKQTARDENGPIKDVVTIAIPGRQETKVSQIFYT
jgi:hypothetical protein